MSNELSSTFHAVADPARRAILARLAEGSATVGELSRPLDMTAPAVSHHLKVLEKAGLIDRRAQGQHRLISLRRGSLDAAADWLEQLRRFWEESFERLDAELAEQMDRNKGDDDE